MLRFLTAGESHGQALVTIVEGLPAGLPFRKEKVAEFLRRRRTCAGRGARMKLEEDAVEVLSGVRGGYTLGSPVALLLRNAEWEEWLPVLSPDPEELEPERAEAKKLTRPRPGHADLAGGIKYHHRDLRNVLERASARETAARVAAGALASLLLEELGCSVFSHVVQIGEVVASPPADYGEVLRAARASPVGCADPEAAERMVALLEEARRAGDTLGGIFEVVCLGLPPGLGSYAHWDRRLDARLAAALMSIPAVKGVEVGLGFRGAAVPGSAYHDAISYSRERGFFRTTNRAGGLEGGVTNGEPLVLRAVVKPIPTLPKPLETVDITTKEPVPAAVERGDTCAVPAAGVVGEAVTAWVLACAVLEKFGGDTLEEIRARWEAYLEYVRSY